MYIHHIGGAIVILCSLYSGCGFVCCCALGLLMEASSPFLNFRNMLNKDE